MASSEIRIRMESTTASSLRPASAAAPCPHRVETAEAAQEAAVAAAAMSRSSSSHSNSGPLGLCIDVDDDTDDGSSSSSHENADTKGGAAAAADTTCTTLVTAEPAASARIPSHDEEQQQQQQQQQEYQQRLEERVEQLELKLATLSRLLQSSTARAGAALLAAEGKNRNKNKKNNRRENSSIPPNRTSSRPQQQGQKSSTPERCVSPVEDAAAPTATAAGPTAQAEDAAAPRTVGTTTTPVPSPHRFARMTATSPHLESPTPHAAAASGGERPMRLRREIGASFRGIEDGDEKSEDGEEGARDKDSSIVGAKEDTADAANTPSSTQPPPPPPPDLPYDAQSSPSLSQQKRNRNLSLMLLFEGNEEEYEKHSASAPPVASMTLAERQWLRPQLLQYQRENQQPPSSNDDEEQEQQQHVRNNSQQAHVYAHEVDIRQPLLPVEEADKPAAAVRRQSSVSFDPPPPTKHAATAKATAAAATTNSGAATDTSGQDAVTGTNAAKTFGENESAPASSSSSSSTFQRRRSSSITKELVKQKLQTKWLDYLNSVQEATPDVDVQMEEFIKVPPALEGILGFGLLICGDSFLYMFTVLPIRFVWSCLLLLLKIASPIWKLRQRRRRQPPHGANHQQQQPQQQSYAHHFEFHRRHLYQIIQFLIVVFILRWVLLPISMGKLYHWIRGQAMIKLYVIVAMVEIFDRLFSSLGQDCLDSLYWNSITRPGSSRFVVSVVVVLVYAAIHSLILFVHVATLNVAMNSHDQALLSLLIGGNFAEIKSTVFKKYNKAALFKITASDICERFKLALFLSLVLLLNVSQGMNQKQLFHYFYICGIVWCAELVADWIKHAFITKFNFLPARVYPAYALLLAGDVTGIGHEGVSLDHSHAVVKRIGFAQIPLLCVMFRLVNEATRKFRRNQEALLSSAQHDLVATTNNNLFFRLLQSFFAANGIRAYLFLWAVLLVLKLGLGVLLERLSFGKLYAAPEYSQLTPLLTKTNSSSSSKAKKTR